jgi:hypothetical protein
MPGIAHRLSRSRALKTRLGAGPDLDVERSSQAEAEKEAYDSVGVK